MPASLDRIDRSLLIAAALLLVALAFATALLTTNRRGARAGFPSSYSTSWDGAKAAYILLGELGYNVRRSDNAPTEFENSPEGQVLILADPFQPPTPEDVAALRRFLEDGGHIVADTDTAHLRYLHPSP